MESHITIEQAEKTMVTQSSKPLSSEVNQDAEYRLKSLSSEQLSPETGEPFIERPDVARQESVILSDEPFIERQESVILSDGHSLLGETDDVDKTVPGTESNLAVSVDGVNKADEGSSEGKLTESDLGAASADVCDVLQNSSSGSILLDSTETFPDVVPGHFHVDGVNGRFDQTVDKVKKQATSTGDDNSIVSQSVSEISVPNNETDDLHAGGSIINKHNHNLTSQIQCEAENNILKLEPFTSLVDVSRLQADHNSDGASGNRSGNAQEQELRSLTRGQGDPRLKKQLKKLLRLGSWRASSSVRKVAWLLVCGHLHKLEKAYVYVQMEKELFGDQEDEDVPLSVWPQQPANEDHVLTEFYLNAKGKSTAHKIVAVISQLSPHITYCPGLLPLIDLFLHYMTAADCFSCVLTLLQSNRPVYLLQSRVAFEASKRVLRDLTKKYAKSAYVALVRSCTNVDLVFDNWVHWIYSDLPFRYAVAITDSYLMEGMKVLYRVVLTILMLYTKYAGQGQHRGTAASVTHSISEFCQHPPVTPAKLLKVAFKIRGFSWSKISKLQHQHESSLNNFKPDMPQSASSATVDEVSMVVSMAQPNTKMMGFHDTGSNMLAVDQLATIWSWLPPRHAINKPVLLFNSADMGTSLTTLYAKMEFEPCTILVIKTITGEVFGAFCAESWLERRVHCRPVRFFGTGETFVFTLVPERVKHEWVGKPDPHVPLSANMFQAGDSSSLMIGGGNGCAIQLDSMMERCRTETCDTFQNPALCPSMDFIPAAVEVFGLR